MIYLFLLCILLAAWLPPMLASRAWRKAEVRRALLLRWRMEISVVRVYVMEIIKRDVQ